MVGLCCLLGAQLLKVHPCIQPIAIYDNVISCCEGVNKMWGKEYAQHILSKNFTSVTSKHNIVVYVLFDSIHTECLCRFNDLISVRCSFPLLLFKSLKLLESLILSFLCVPLVWQNQALVGVVWGLADPPQNNLSPILVTGFHPHVDHFHQLPFTRKIDIEPGECVATFDCTHLHSFAAVSLCIKKWEGLHIN